MKGDLTEAAAGGWRWQRAFGDQGDQAAFMACPLPTTTTDGRAWHLGRHLAKGGFSKPDADMRVVSLGPGLFRTARYEDGRPVHWTETRFQWNGDLGFEELN